MNKDSNISVEEKYNSIKEYFDEYNKKEECPYYKIDYSSLTQDGKINEELVNKISDININASKDILLNMLDDINIKAYGIYAKTFNEKKYSIFRRSRN